ncbi:hypothetical protein [Lichenibacterium dinghuense]|uniref:hypothetical protein n=1 Tax=Lichenibacterium dinghuense TaxID=2895977 RepID=UPI001F1DB0B1|nr:hypothetical protein [Lichenibacterium sp. 6Y81]
MTGPAPSRPREVPRAPARSIPIRTVPRATLEALVARLVASGAVVAPTNEAPR